MLIVRYLEGLCLLVDAHKGELTVHLNVRPPEGIFIRQNERDQICLTEESRDGLIPWIFAWESAHLLFYFSLNQSIHWKLCLAIFATPFHWLCGLLWGHVLRNFSRYLPLLRLPTNFFPRAPSFALKRTYNSGNICRWAAQVINDPGALGFGTWILPCIFVVRKSRKYKSRRFSKSYN